MFCKVIEKMEYYLYLSVKHTFEGLVRREVIR